MRSARGACVVLASLAAVVPARAAPPDPAVVDEWALSPGFALDLDADGFHLPAALVFVPEPGAAPSDPLYFVAELRGRIQVVTNAREVRTFAEGFPPMRPNKELPDHEGEGGLAGLCLDPERGHVFATYLYQDDRGVLRNGITRLTAAPRTFAGAARDRLPIHEPFVRDVSALAHQVGGCRVHDGLLHVSVGDGEQPLEARNLDSTLGKILRMTVDGDPAPGNPHAGDGARAYVFARGLRNPFGQRFVEGRLFVSDNGALVDRFVSIEAGGDYLWSGHDWSITARADFVFTPSQGPVHVDYLPAADTRFPEDYRGAFYVALAGKPEARGQRFDRAEGVALIPYDLERSRVSRPPSYLVRYRRQGQQAVSALAFGPGGLYFAPMLPAEGQDRSPVLRVSHAPDRAHPHTPDAPIAHLGCRACHVIGGAGGLVGPSLESGPLRSRLLERLTSPAYLEQLDAADAIDAEPFASYREGRARLRQLQGEARVREWIVLRLMEPKFDDPKAQMPNLAITREQAEALLAELLGAEGAESAPAGADPAAAEPPARRAEPESIGIDEVLEWAQLAVLLIVGFALGFVVGSRRGSRG